MVRIFTTLTLLMSLAFIGCTTPTDSDVDNSDNSSNSVSVNNVSVVKGYGSGSYQVESNVTITANDPIGDSLFDLWSGTGLQYLTVYNQSSATFSMPSSDISFTALYRHKDSASTILELYSLDVSNGTGTGDYQVDSAVTITANSPVGDSVFDMWSGTGLIYLTAFHQSPTTLSMPPSNISLTAVYRHKDSASTILELYSLDVSNGTGTGDYQVDSTVTITANSPVGDSVFDMWSGTGLIYLTAFHQSPTTFSMPPSNISLTATYKESTTDNSAYPKITDILVIKDGENLTFIADAFGEELTYYWCFDADSDGYSSNIDTTATSSVSKTFSSGEHWVVLWVEDEDGDWSDSYTSAKTTIAGSGGGDDTGGHTTGGSSSLNGDGSSNYDLHSNITAALFWVGEPANGSNGGIQNIESFWRGDWMDEYGIEDGPYISRYSDGFPSSSSYENKENPYYFSLPYNDLTDLVSDGDGDGYGNYVRDPSLTPDVNDGEYTAKLNRVDVVPWADDSSDVSIWKSIVKNRWIKITANENTCYAQWEDAGPYYYNDIDYVFGDDDPENGNRLGAGIDLSPAVMLKLFGDAGTGSEAVDWQFIDQDDVPDGDWGKVITTSKVGGW